MMRLFRRLTAMLTCLIASAACISDEQLCDQSSLSIWRSDLSNYVDQKTVRQVFQDSAGFIWLVTQDSVYRYDGAEVRTLVGERARNSFKLNHSGVRQIIESESGEIWIATDGGGLLRYSKEHERLINVELAQYLLAESEDNLTTVMEGKQGNIWIGYSSGLIARFNPIDDSFRFLLDETASSTANGAITDLAQLNDGTLIIATASRGVIAHKYGHGSKRIYPMPNATERPITSIKIGSDQTIWIATFGAGITAIDPDTWKSSRYLRSETDRKISSNFVNHLSEDKQGRIWVSTDSGLDIIESGKTAMSFHDGNSNLNSTPVLNTMHDTTGSVWIGTSYGIFRGIYSRFESLDTKSGLLDSSTIGFTQDSLGNIWVASAQGLSKYLRPDKEQCRLKPSNYRKAYPEKRVTAITFLADNLYLGFRGSGIVGLPIDIDGHSAQTLENWETLSESSVTDLQANGSSELWVATFGAGITRLKPPTSDYLRVKHNPEAYRTNRILRVAAIDETTVLAGTTDGLSMYSYRAENLEAIPLITVEGEVSGPVTAIHKAHSGDIWIGTQYSGLFRWAAIDRSAGDQVIHKYYPDRDLPSRTIHAIQSSKDSMLWLSTTNGLVRLDPQTGKTVVFDRRDGLQDNEFNFGASFIDRDGYLYFGGNRGFNRFNPNNIVVDTTPPKVVLTSAEFADKEILYDESYIPIDSVHLSYKDYFMNFRFSALDYRENSQIQYRYALENFTPGWVDLGNKHSLRFTSLSSGVYTLKVRASGADGSWAKEGLDIKIYMHPPPWFAWWAFSIYGGMLIGASQLVRKYYDNYAQKERSDKHAQSMEMTADRALNDFQTQIVTEGVLAENIRTHALNTLSLIATALEGYRQSGEPSEATEGFENTINHVTSLITLEEHLNYQHGQACVSAQELFDALIERQLRDTSTDKFEIVPINQSLHLQLPSSISAGVTLIVNELLTNTVLHAFEDKLGVQTLSISMTREKLGGPWTLVYRDSGCGLPRSISMQNPTTFGMTLIADCLSALNASCHQKYDEGAFFSIEIPYREDHQPLV